MLTISLIPEVNLRARVAMAAVAESLFIRRKGTLCHLRDHLEGMLADMMMESADEGSLPALLLRKSAVLAGPGMGTGPEALQVLGQVVAQTPGPLLLDADALTLLAAHPQLAEPAAGRLVLTPHPGEMARLLGWSPSSSRSAATAASSGSPANHNQAAPAVRRNLLRFHGSDIALGNVRPSAALVAADVHFAVGAGGACALNAHLRTTQM